MFCTKANQDESRQLNRAKCTASEGSVHIDKLVGAKQDLAILLPGQLGGDRLAGGIRGEGLFHGGQTDLFLLVGWRPAIKQVVKPFDFRAGSRRSLFQGAAGEGLGLRQGEWMI